MSKLSKVKRNAFRYALGALVAAGMFKAGAIVDPMAGFLASVFAFCYVLDVTAPPGPRSWEPSGASRRSES